MESSSIGLNVGLNCEKSESEAAGSESLNTSGTFGNLEATINIEQLTLYISIKI